MFEHRINRLLGVFGVELKRTRTFPSLQSLLRWLFRAHEVDCVFDVGGNVGGYGQFLREVVGYRGLIISFEPVSATFRELQPCAARDGKWVACKTALGAEDGSLTIHITNVNTFSSFLTPQHGTVADFRGQNEVQGQEVVPVQRLDSVFQKLRSEHGFRHPFLKMDTQGFDREVLAGAQEVLKEFVALQSETSLLPIYAKMPGLAEMYPLISEMGFDLLGMYPVNRDRSGRCIEADSVFLRRPAELPQAQRVK